MKLHLTGSGLQVHTPAKVNLSLRVLGKREDGFHELETLFASVGLYDTLQVDSAPEGELTLTVRIASSALQHLTLSSDSSNLILRAADLLRRRLDKPLGARITLWKRIPVEAGLGGGSSDAAATLVALNRLWGNELDQPSLHSLAAQLGSDVNFFLDSRHLGWGWGRGEAIEPVTTRRPLYLVLVKPKSGLSTKRVFEELNAPRFDHAANMSSASSENSCEPLDRLVQNDLEPVARRLNVDVNRILEALRKEQLLAVAMTGSGTACFGLCHTRRQAQSVSARLRARQLGEVVCVGLNT